MAESGSGAPAPTDRDIVIIREFDAPRPLVWDAWTRPEHLARWWGPRVFTNPVCELDVRPGGRFRIVMRAPDGTDYPMSGVYREVVPPERLVYTNDLSGQPEAWMDMLNDARGTPRGTPVDDSVVTVTFVEREGRTTVTISTRFASAAEAQAFRRMMMVEGWTESLVKLAALLAGGGGR
ncbi:MAG: SRPBCC domain-containing protein [Gemmatimonadota bacterium]|nr:SRPBCC domain-containing protein [Gemmatimonadota bacterium]MDE3216978.1 SRPBCC domain-containing protein [Gemmatimonadota bacterium]